jgi:aspartate racemase
LKKIVGLVEADDLNGLSEHLVREIYKLQRASAVFGVLAANTPHVVLDEVQRQSTIPVIEGLILGGTEPP